MKVSNVHKLQCYYCGAVLYDVAWYAIKSDKLKGSEVFDSV